MEHRPDAPLPFIDGGIWLRFSARAYNEIDDYERLAELVRQVLEA
jgi:isopenicillin-N epimerase